jgi:hypothetical protein
MKEATLPRSDELSRWLELDLLRAWAATLMIVNHLGVGVKVDAYAGLLSAFVFMGSFAPVVFFFLTGLGYGVQSVVRTSGRSRGYLLKVGILLAADAFLWMKPGQFIGNDFLGFIGISMLLLEWIRRSSRSLDLALGLVGLTVLSRFIVGPMLRHWLAGSSSLQWLGFLLGANSLPRFSYPPCPWLAYPALGYVFGRLAALHRDLMSSRSTAIALCLLAVCAASAVMTLALTLLGANLFRFGSVSSGFFMASLSALSLSLLLITSVCRMNLPDWLLRLCSLSGIRSLAIVPLHYWYRAAVLLLMGPIESIGSYAAVVLVGVIVCFASSSAVPMITALLRTPERIRKAWIMTGFAAAVAAWALWNGMIRSPIDWFLRSPIQLAFCILLGVSRPNAPRRNTSEPSSTARPVAEHAA